MVILVLVVVALALTLYHASPSPAGGSRFPYLWIPLFLLGLAVLALVYGGIR
jgi:hypothetical protein